MINLFEIKNSVLSYGNNGWCIYIPELNFPETGISVLFGKSGSGKTTLLEALGLMRNTFDNPDKHKKLLRFIFKNVPELSKNYTEAHLGSPSYIKLNSSELNGDSDCFESLFKYIGSNNNENFSIWDRNKTSFFSDIFRGEEESKLDEIRRKYYSFIFQNTNLMPNFSAAENVALPGMAYGFQNNNLYKNYSNPAKHCEYYGIDDKCVALQNAFITLKDDLDIRVAQAKKMSDKLSGGQKQRVAFARAFNSNYKVLFGDEATGNLDHKTARSLMNALKRKIKDTSAKPISAILVSHDIELTLEYANRIIVINTFPYFSYSDENGETILLTKQDIAQKFNKINFDDLTDDDLAKVFDDYQQKEVGYILPTNIFLRSEDTDKFDDSLKLQDYL